VSNWEQVAVRFVNQTSKWERDNDIAGFIPFGLGILRTLTGAYMTLQLVMEDADTVRVKDATPFFINDVVFEPAAVMQFLEAHQFSVIHWKTIPEKNNLFADILLALSSAVIIPVKCNDKYHVVILGWQEPQSFGDFFQEFTLLVQNRLQEILDQCCAEQHLQQRTVHMLAILRTLPYSLVFISDDGSGTGWVNKRAAALLQLKEFGIQQPEVLAAAMAQLRNNALNKEALNKEAMQLFSSPAATLENWIWQLVQPSPVTLNVACLPMIEQDVIKGRLWIFREEV
jgi:hypothetical protein